MTRLMSSRLACLPGRRYIGCAPAFQLFPLTLCTKHGHRFLASPCCRPLAVLCPPIPTAAP